MDTDPYAAHFDESEAPLFFVKYPQHATVEALNLAYEKFCAWSTMYKRIAYVIDLTEFNPLTASATMRKAFADAFEKNRALMEPATVCEARIVSSSLVQGIITAVDWLRGPKYPVKNFTNYDAAHSWASRELRQALARL